MMPNTLARRTQTYFQLNTKLAYLNQEQISTLFENALETTRGWGINHVVQLENSKVFIKRVPLTALEYQHPFSTKNHFGLPTYYNYGVGSAGFGTYRELLTQIKTTNWVLSGACEHFPLLYHYRVMPRSVPETPLNVEGYEQYVTYWNSNEQIGKYALERRNAPYEIVLFLEYFPHTLGDWYRHNVEKTESIVAQMADVLAFLRKHGVRHLDLGFQNILSDGERIYVADFGLALDGAFELSAAERQFFETHELFDYLPFLRSLAYYVAIKFNEQTEAQKQALVAKYGLGGSELTSRDRSILLENLVQLREEGELPLEQNFVEMIVTHIELVRFAQTFYGALFDNDTKDAVYDHARLRALLESAEFLKSADSTHQTSV